MTATPSASNPLLHMTDLPRFDQFAPDLVSSAVDTLLDQARQTLEHVLSPQVAASFDQIAAPLSMATERLSRVWGMVSHLRSVADEPALREVYKAKLPVLTEFYTALGSDERLYRKYRDMANNKADLTPDQRTLLSHWLRDFVLGGAELQGEEKQRYAAIQERQAMLSQQFSEHVLDATDQFTLSVSPDELAGVPDDVLQATRQDDGQHKLSLHMPVYLPVMQYATQRDLRAKLYRAYVTRASELGLAEQDNSAIMAELLALKHEEAQLLGYPSYADVSLASKMAQSPQEVETFLLDLAVKARPYALRDWKELQDFARDHCEINELQAWDVAFVSEKLKEARYAFSEQEVKAYFTEPAVLGGLFRIIQNLFQVRIEPQATSVWHPSVRFYRVERDGQTLAHFYLDPYARTGKRPGAWMDDARSRWLRPDTESVQTPVAYLVCNFAPPQGDQPALLTHDDVTTLFHEFGHGLHHMLTQVSELGISGISGVEWDAVELPSQFMENFCWEYAVLQDMTAHHTSGQALPRELFNKMLAAKNFQSGLQTLRQIEFSLFDLRIHSAEFQNQHSTVMSTLANVRAQVSVVTPPDFNRFAHTFSHIFAGGYSAGYYSYKWAEVLSADCWSAFEESDPLDASTGQRFMREILEKGASRTALENFKAFRGREPKIDALLRHQGMAQTATA